MDFVAYAIPQVTPLPLEPADLKRDWMEGTKALAAAKHPALARGNQAGWVMRCPIDIRFTWNGDMRPHQGLTSFSHDPDRDLYYGIFSNAFGHGVLTISVPYLFRTPPGYGLFVRGPANHQVEHMQPLDGLVETDWLESSFTMNWRILVPNVSVGFKKGEPLCMIVPYPLTLLEATTPELLVAPVAGAFPAPEVAADGTWRNPLPVAGTGLDAASAPGKVRMRLKAFQRAER